MAFVTEQDDVGDGVVEHWTILDGAGPWVTMVQLLPGHLKESVVYFPVFQNNSTGV